MTELERIKANAALVIQQVAASPDFEWGLNAASVQYLQDYIERNRETLHAETITKLVSIFGSFYGECIIAWYGGAWEWGDAGWGIRVNQRLICFPFAKVAKQFAHGAANGGDGIFDAFEMIGILATTDISLE